MKIDYTPCFILHRRNFSESSYILEIFSRDYGRINIIAKGAKNSKKYHGILIFIKSIMCLGIENQN